MSRINICAEIQCAHYAGVTKACQRYSVSNHCPVSFIQGVEPNQYALYADDSLAPIVFDCARSCCPDLAVKLGSIDLTPELIERLETVDKLSGGDEGRKTIDAIEQFHWLISFVLKIQSYVN